MIDMKLKLHVFMITLKNIFLSLLLLSLFLLNSCKKNPKELYNLDFEIINAQNGLPKDWFQYAEYPLSLSKDAISGRYAAALTSTGNGNYGRLATVLPAIYDGDTIQLEGYIKAKNIMAGEAGLFISVRGSRGDDSDLSLQYKSTENNEIKGMSEWTKFQISCPLPKDADYVEVGGYFSGKGQVYFDKFRVTIDGRDIQFLKNNGKKVYKALLDKEFEVGSKIRLKDLSPHQSNNLFLLGKIWGFLKYYNPEVGNGEINWDYELFRILPDFVSAKHSEQRNAIIHKWIRKYKPKEDCETCIPAASNAIQKPNFEWIEQNNFTSEIKAILYEIYENRHQGNHFYVNSNPGIGNPLFTHEGRYYFIPSSDDGFRLLALYKYWNIIEFFFPYKHLIGKSWDQVLKEYIPIFVGVENTSEYEQVLTQLITEIRDTHAVLYGKKEKEKYYAPIEVKFIENKLVVTSNFNSGKVNNSGLKIGDIIVEINGVPVEKIVDSLSRTTPASNKASLMRAISLNVLESHTNIMKITYASESGDRDTALTLYPDKEKRRTPYTEKLGKKSYSFLKDSIGYINLESIRSEEIEPIKNEFYDANGIIIDMRNYPNIFVPFLLGSFFVDQPTPFVKFSKVNENNYGEFNFTEPLTISPEGRLFSKKLVVLVNEQTQSQAEYTAMAFRAGNNTTILGSTTAGADGNVSYLNLPSGYSTRISGIGVYYPNGKATQRVGIVADIQISPTIVGVKERKDELLEKAIEIINSQN